jgi:hypothetical protein
MLKNTLRLLALSLPLLLGVGAILVTPKRVKADGTDPIPLCPAGCVDGCKWIPGQAPVCTVPPKGATHTLTLQKSECLTGPVRMRGEWAGDGIDFIATDLGDYTAICKDSVTLSEDKQCKIGICCHWIVIQSSPYIIVDANFNPQSSVWARTACNDNSTLPQCNL